MDCKKDIFTAIFTLTLILSLFSVVNAVHPTTELGFNNTSRIYRGDSFRAYADWNETVNVSVVTLDTENYVHNSSHPVDSSDLFNETFNSTWTNYTINTSSSWPLGSHYLAINVTSTVDNGSQTYNYTEKNFTLFGNLSIVRIPSPDRNSIHHEGDEVPFEAKVKDDNDTTVSGINVSFYDPDGSYIGSNLTGASEKDEKKDIAGINYTMPGGELGEKIYTANITNTTEYRDVGENMTIKIYQYGWSELNQSDLSGTTGEDVEKDLYCQVIDSNASEALEGYEVKFWSNGSPVGTETTNSSGWASMSYSWSEPGEYDVSCNITNSSDLYYNSSSPSSLPGSMNVEEVAPYYLNASDDAGDNVTEGTEVNVSVFWNTTYFDLDTGTLYHNASGSMTDLDSSSFNSTPDWYNYTIDTLDHEGETICWKQYANDRKGNLNDTMANDTYCFEVVPDSEGPKFYNLSTNTSEIAGETIEFSSEWTDNKGLENYTFYLDNCTGDWTNVSDNWDSEPTEAWVNNTSSNLCPAGGTLKWKVEVTDICGNTNSTGDQTVELYNSSRMVIEGDDSGSLAHWFDDYNIGFNDTVSTGLTIENPGKYNLTWNNSSSSSYLVYDYDSNMSLSVDWPTEPIQPGDNETVQVEATINTEQTDNDAGIYSGQLVFNTTNETNVASPEVFTVDLKLNLTDELTVDPYQIDTGDGDDINNVSEDVNVTPLINVSYINGTRIKDDLHHDNFSAWMTEKNTSYRVDLDNIYNHTDGIWDNTEKVYRPVTEVPVDSHGDNGIPGGYYELYYNTTYDINDVSLPGEGYYEHLLVNNTGLEFEVISDDTLEMDDDEENEVINVTVTNHGPLDATADISLDDTDTDYTNCLDDITSDGNCEGGGTSYSYETIESPLISGNSSCQIWWEFDAENVTEDESCEIRFETNDLRFNDPIIEVNVTNTAEESEETSEQQSETTCDYTDWSDEGCGDGACDDDEMYQTRTSDVDNCTNTQRCIDSNVCGSFGISLEIEEEAINVTQGGSAQNKLFVKNTGDRDVEDLRLHLETDAPEAWYDVSPVSMDLDEGDDDEYEIDFEADNVSTVASYPITYLVNSSDVSEEMDGELWVLPTEEGREEINESFDRVRSNWTELEIEYLNLKNSDADTSSVDGKVDDLNKTIREVEQAIKDGDYVTANEKLQSARQLQSELEEDIKKIEEESGPNLLLIGIGIVLILVIGVGLYIFMPSPSGYHPKKGYEKSGKENELRSKAMKAVDKIKSRLNRDNKKKKKGKYKYKGKKK
ncbi:MAG: hypothetical protein ACLFS3_00815 [Candidatus Aenigmatarchaeota archaeon]